MNNKFFKKVVIPSFLLLISLSLIGYLALSFYFNSFDVSMFDNSGKGVFLGLVLFLWAMLTLYIYAENVEQKEDNNKSN